jgi:NAD(P)-dependent dehydrogenase (short-subunit alcohol dehydrogenase family)
MAGRINIVTGANAGIGFEIAKGLARGGERVVMACRDPVRSEAARVELVMSAGSANVELFQLDMSSLASIRAFAAQVRSRFGRIDTLISNAGVVPGKRRDTQDGFEEAFAVNFLGPFLLVDQLMPLLNASSEPRIIFMGGSAEKSGKIAWDDLQLRRGFQPMVALAQSRLAQMIYARELARRHPDMAINVVDPGPTRTGVLKELPAAVRFLSWFFKSPAKAAETPLWLATAPETAHVRGKYFRNKKEAQPSETARNDELAARLWDVAAALVNA